MREATCAADSLRGGARDARAEGKETRRPHGSTHLLGAAVYGLLVFAGAAAFGFVAAPAVARAVGLFAIYTDSQATLSLLTVKAIPVIWGTSVVAAIATCSLRSQ